MQAFDRQTDGQTDRQTDGQTDRIPIAIPRLHSMQRGKNKDYLTVSDDQLSEMLERVTPKFTHTNLFYVLNRTGQFFSGRFLFVL